MTIDDDNPRSREEGAPETTPLTALTAATPAHQEEAHEAELAEHYELPGGPVR